MKIVIIGAGGQARVACEILKREKDLEIIGFIDPVLKEPDEKIMEIPVLGDSSVLPNLIANGVRGFFIGIGDNKVRSRRFEEMKNMGLEPVNAIHHTANIADDAKIGKGNFIAMGAIISIGVTIGDNTIINTGTTIDHDCVIESGAHIAPGSHLGGAVRVGKEALIGIGVNINRGVKVGADSVIVSGMTIIDDVPPGHVAKMRF